MKKLIYKMIITLGAILFSQLASAKVGGIGDGGGQSIVCRDDNGTVISAELLDLYEAKYFYLLNIQNPSVEKNYLDVAIAKAAILDAALPAAYPVAKTTVTSGGQTEVNYQVSAGVFFQRENGSTPLQLNVRKIDFEKLLIPGDISIPSIGDSNPRIIPKKKGCEIEQVAIYKDGTNEVRFVENIWNQLSTNDKAALLIHEALYRQLRLMGDMTSDRTRKVIGHLFGGTTFKWILDGSPENFLNCWTTDPEHSFHFIVYGDFKGATPTITAQFLIWNSEVVLSEIKTQLPFDPTIKLFFPQEIVKNSNFTFMGQIQNPLLEKNTFSISYAIDPRTYEMNIFFQTSYGAFDSARDLPVVCKPQFNQVK